MAQKTHVPILFGIILFVLHFLSAYPGGMSPDTFSQFHQSINLDLASHHPPITAILWHYLNFIYQGPQVMLFFHLGMLWSGVLLMFYADSSNKFRWIYFAIPLFPMILAQSGYIWKDITFSFAFFFGV